MPARRQPGPTPPAKKLKTTNAALPADEEVNLAYYHAVQEDCHKILTHLGEDFPCQPAVAIAKANEESEGGIQEPYSSDAASRALGNQGAYVAAVNMFWMDFLKSPTPGVPLRRKSVEDLADYIWPQGALPSFLLKLLEVQAPASTTVAEVPQGLQMLSPEGYAHAALCACARDLPQHKEQWARILRSVPCAFVVVPSGGRDVWIHAWNKRNAITQDYESLSRTALQQAIEIATLKSRFEADEGRPLNNGDFFQLLTAQGLKKASSQDDLSPNLIANAIQVYEKIRGPEMLEPLADLETRYGSKSCLNEMCNLHALAQKPKPEARVFVLQGIHDLVVRGLVNNEDITKTSLRGDKSNAGWIALLELKRNCLQHWLTIELPKAKVADKDRMLLKEKLASHKAYRENLCGEDVSWQGGLARSSLEALQLLEKLVFNKHYDNGLKGMARAHKNAKEVTEHDSIREDWSKVVSMRENELMEEAVKDKMDQEALEEEPTVLASMRKPPTAFSEHSLGYWTSLANTSVRRHVSFVVVPGTQGQMQRLVAQSSLKDLEREEGKKLVMVWLDTDLMGEAPGPKAQPGLRRSLPLEANGELRSIVHGTMQARGAQLKTAEGETTCPAPGELICVHDGGRKIMPEVRKLFRAMTSKGDILDCNEKQASIVFNEETIRVRKQRIKSSEAYTCQTSMSMFTRSILVPTMIPEKRRAHYQGYNTGDVIGWVDAVPANALWEAPRPVKEKVLGKKTLTLTAAEEGLSKDQKQLRAAEGRLETVFSGTRLPQQFHSELLASLCCQGVVDLTPGQGFLEQACLDARVPVLAVCLSEAHAEALEERLTKYCLSKFVEQGHTLYREGANKFLKPDGSIKEDKGDDEPEEVPKPKPKAKPKASKKKKRVDDDNSGDDEEPEDDTEAGDTKRPPKKKKSKKEDAEASSGSEELW
ncbi:unnamed protein product [Effrenium voratum]|nr:unnamed protein product [Effrenium voratum]